MDALLRFRCKKCHFIERLYSVLQGTYVKLYFVPLIPCGTVEAALYKEARQHSVAESCSQSASFSQADDMGGETVVHSVLSLADSVLTLPVG